MHNYLIISNDLVTIDDNINSILNKNKLSKDNLIKYDMSEILLEQVIEELNTYSLFIENKVVVLTSCFFLSSVPKKNSIKQDTDILIRYLNNPNPNNILIIVCDNLDERLKVNKIIKEKMIVMDNNISIEEKIKSSLENYNMDYKTIIYLINYLNKNNYRILNEIEKLKIYKCDDKIITIDDINKIVVKEFDDDIFSLINSIINKDLKKSISIYKKLVFRGEDITRIVITLADQIRLIYRTKILINTGKGKDYISKYLNVHPYRCKLAMESSYNFTEDELINYLKKLSEIDIGIKTGNIVSEFSFETLLLELNY